MTVSKSGLVISIVSFVAGAWAFVATQAATKDVFEPIVAACTNKDYVTMEDFVSRTGYHRYDKRVGLVVLDFLVCLITQFMVDLREKSPAGLLTWGATMLSASPAVMLLLLEAGRSGSRGILLWPVLIQVMAQLLGISVVFPVIWVPAYIFFGNTEGGAVNLMLVRSLFFLVAPGMFFTVMVFALDTDTDLWTTCAGTLGGPILCFIGLAPYFLPPPTNPTPKDIALGAESAALSFGIGGVVALLGWFYLVYTVLATYGTDYQALYKDVWGEAHPSIQFMTIDATVLWVGLVLHIASRKMSSVGEVLLLTPFFGPGAACSMALASIEMDRMPTLGNVQEEAKKDK
jgi:hypothetical protein